MDWTLVTQSRSASLTASFKVALPRYGVHCAPSSCMRKTLRDWRWVSSYHPYRLRRPYQEGATVPWPRVLTGAGFGDEAFLPRRRASNA